MFLNNLSDYEKKYTSLLNKIENFLLNAPYGHIKVQKKNNSYFYYLCETGKKNGKYLKKENNEQLIEALCIKHYYKQLLPVVKKDLMAIRSALKKSDRNTISEIYDLLSEGIKEKVSCLELSEQEYTRRWIATPYSTNPKPFDNENYVTKKGELVRSKTELIIADKLFDKNIPYKYEKKITFSNYGEIYPDFTVLNTKNRQVYIWEHFGRIGDSDYRKQALKKISVFREHETNYGYRFVCTFEDEQNSINSKQIDAIIDNYFI